MSIVKTYDTFCDAGRTTDCIGWADGASSTEGAKEARKQARALGWKRIDGQDVCPACQAANAR